MFLPVMNDHHLSLNSVQLVRQFFTGNRKIELFGCNGNILIACHAVEYHLAFVSFDDITAVRELL